MQKLKRKSVKHRNDRSFPTAAGELPENSKKNRYKDILPFDYSRVVLSLQTDEATSDYINANFVQGLNGPRTYIATQGPLAHTVIDFWRMIWEYGIKVIVMACQEVEAAKRKCEMYWAEENKPKTYGSFLVECETEDACKGYFVRTLKVTFKEESREIFHFQFPSWPDHGVPESPNSILCMVAHIHRKQGAAASPICMHCSAGCGRTGALCVIHYTWDLIKSKV
uniref:protein-tyrosine-phosphatase n=1 Tax=Petromyzon marinus TaxID=7757 RepID=S4RJU6_PETMA